MLNYVLPSSAIFLPPSKIESFYDLFWFVGVNDFILKFVSVIFKVGLILLPNTIVPFKKRVRHILSVNVLVTWISLIDLSHLGEAFPLYRANQPDPPRIGSHSHLAFVLTQWV